MFKNFFLRLPNANLCSLVLEKAAWDRVSLKTFFLSHTSIPASFRALGMYNILFVSSKGVLSPASTLADIGDLETLELRMKLRGGGGSTTTEDDDSYEDEGIDEDDDEAKLTDQECVEKFRQSLDKFREVLVPAIYMQDLASIKKIKKEGERTEEKAALEDCLGKLNRMFELIRGYYFGKTPIFDKEGTLFFPNNRSFCVLINRYREAMELDDLSEYTVEDILEIFEAQLEQLPELHTDYAFEFGALSLADNDDENDSDDEITIYNLIEDAEDQALDISGLKERAISSFRQVFSHARNFITDRKITEKTASSPSVWVAASCTHLMISLFHDLIAESSRRHKFQADHARAIFIFLHVSCLDIIDGFKEEQLEDVYIKTIQNTLEQMFSEVAAEVENSRDLGARYNQLKTELYQKHQIEASIESDEDEDLDDAAKEEEEEKKEATPRKKVKIVKKKD